MNEIETTVVAMEPGVFGVQIREGELTTSHRVHVPDDLLDDLGLFDVDHETLVRETIDFLLDREKPTEIMGEFSLSDVPRYFPDYYDELKTRVAP